MKHWDRSTRTYDFFYAVVLLATLALTQLSFVVELVEHAGLFTSDVGQASQASAIEVRSKERSVQIAEAGEKK